MYCYFGNMFNNSIIVSAYCHRRLRPPDRSPGCPSSKDATGWPARHCAKVSITNVLLHSHWLIVQQYTCENVFCICIFMHLTSRCECLVFSGIFFRNKLKYLSFLRKRCNVNPQRGPFHQRAPSKIFQRTVRGKISPNSIHELQYFLLLKIFYIYAYP